MSNTAVGSGGAIYESDIYNTSINNCSVQNSGGAIQAQRLTHVQIESSVFNVADYGRLMSVYQGATSDIHSRTFMEHTANLDGGDMAIYKNKCNVYVASFGGIDLFAEYESLVFAQKLFPTRKQRRGCRYVLSGY